MRWGDTGLERGESGGGEVTGPRERESGHIFAASSDCSKDGSTTNN